MPQATDEQRALMKKWFGEEIDDGMPIMFLMSRGYTFQAGIIYPPTLSHAVSHDEGECIDFLCDEWDFGWLSFEKRLALSIEPMKPVAHGNPVEQAHDGEAMTTPQQSSPPAPQAVKELVERLKPDKVMTPEEYERYGIQGWHAICWNIDGFMNVGVQFGIASLQEDRDRLERDLAAERERGKELEAALQLLRREAWWMTRQLAFHGQPGTKGDLVDQALALAEAALSRPASTEPSLGEIE